MKDVLLRVRLYLTAELAVRLDRRHYAELSLTRSWMGWLGEASRSRPRSPSCPRALSREDRHCGLAVAADALAVEPDVPLGEELAQRVELILLRLRVQYAVNEMRVERRDARHRTGRVDPSVG